MNGMDWTVVVSCCVITLGMPRFLRAAGLLPRRRRNGDAASLTGEEKARLVMAEHAWRDHAGTLRVQRDEQAAEMRARGVK